jgi:hypothetical protein
VVLIQIPIPNKYLGFGYKDIVLCRNNGSLLNGKHGQGTHITKMGADNSAKNTPNAPQNCLSTLSAQAQKFGILMKKGFIGRP